MSAPDPLRLASVVGRHLGAPVTVEGLRRLSGGASRESWSFDAVTGDGTRHGLVLRRDPPGYPGTSARDVELDVLRAARAGGVATPEPWTGIDPDDDLGAGFVMERVEGETIPRRILRDDEYDAARPRLARQCGEQAARIHAVPVDQVARLLFKGAAEQLDEYRAVLDELGEPHPAFELGLRWLADHLPDHAPDAAPGATPDAAPGAGPDDDDTPCLVHGDFRNGNLVVGADGLRAVLDWELAHLGDPAEDLGWLCVKSWRFGAVEHRVGGFGDVDALLASYRDAGGGDITPERLHYWETFGTLKWGIICMVQAFTHLHGAVRSIELAALGRRAAEMEWDLLALIEAG